MKSTLESRCGFGPRQYEKRIDGPLYKFCNETTPAGVLALTYDFGIAVYDISGDECIAAWIHGSSCSGAHRHAINYSTAGRPFIKKGGARYYLDNFIRAQ